ncbi:hypothetical protein PG994_004113 [Apiospora phragmitis]|uniref:Uncharacterized protein n=1 Tax=Apiospora phragmitis TaxID=2905665 RepID=A0ABR1VPP1_9PEZI
MRTAIVLTVFWTLLSLAFGSPLAQARPGRPGISHLDIATPERVAKATEIVNKRYQEAAERAAQSLPEKTQNATNPGVFSKDIVYCGKDQVDKKMFDTAHQLFKDWCDSDDGHVRAFHHQYMDFGNVRIAICNWGLYNPCQGTELDAAWTALELVCPDEVSAATGKETVSTGMWYKGDWLKGYYRSNCTTGEVCNGDRTGIPCRNEGF